MSTRTQATYRADPDLRARLQAYTPDEPGSVFPFTARLAAETGWTRAQALRALEEYRRFLYLAATAGHVVTPSKAVDEVWHLHLIYTRSYWDDLCGRVLGFPLHHDPSSGGAAQDAFYAGAYARTLASYRAAFLAEPPRDLWPRPGDPAPSPSRLPDPRRGERRDRLAVALGAAALTTVCTAAAGGSLALVLFVAAVVSVIVGMAAFTNLESPRRERRRGAGKHGAKSGLAAGADGGDVPWSDASCGSDTGSHGHSCGGGHACGGHSCGGGCGSSCGSGCGGGCGGH